MKNFTSDSEARNVRTFTAATLREALALVRAELGADALILGQQQHGRRISVQAALELPDPAEPNSEPTTQVDDVVVAESGVADIQFSQQQNSTLGAAIGKRAVEPADAAGATLPQWAQTFSAEVLQQLPPCNTVDEVREVISTRLNYAHKAIAGLQGCYRFLGAPGVGKSTTLIKVLVEWVMHSNPRDVVVITTDRQRLAGTEALHLTCQMLNVDIHECGESELAGMVARFARKTLVLVDAPAMHLGKSQQALQGVNDIWVCSALHSANTLQAQYQCISRLKPVGVVVTQLDQCADGDAIANLLYQWRLPLYWLGTDCELPGGIESADSESVYLRFFPKAQTVHLDVAV